MGLVSNIQRRLGSKNYYARARIPNDLLSLYKGKKELWKSLKTSDPAEAKRRGRQVLDAWDRDFATARHRGPLSEHDLQEAVWKRYEELLEADQQFRHSLPTDKDLDKIYAHVVREFGEYDLHAYRIFEFIRDRFEVEKQQRAERLATLQEEAARGETRSVADQVKLHEESPDYRKLAHALQRAEIEALKRAQERDRGEFGGKPNDEFIRPPVAGVSGKKGEIMGLFESYAAENPLQVRVDTLNQSRMAVRLFVDTVGDRFPVSMMDKKVVRNWKALLLKYPVKAAEMTAFKGMSLRETVIANEKVGKPVISPRTVNRYLSGLGAFCDWLMNHEYLNANPTHNLYIRQDKSRRATKPFSSEQLQTLFNSPLFTGCQSNDKWHLPGDHRIRDHRYWLPLIMLYSGARPGEIAQLLVDDVHQSHGRWIIHITEERDDTKSTKTKGSMRVLPVHPELEKLGFIAYHRSMVERREKRLFPDAERNARGQMAAEFDRDINRYLTRIGIKHGRGLSLYSLRHGFADALRLAGFLDEQFGILLGHTNHTMTGRYGTLQQGMLRQRAEMIDAVSYPGLNLSPLYPS